MQNSSMAGAPRATDNRAPRSSVILRICAVGVSNFMLHDWTLLQSAMQTPLVIDQIELSLAAHQGFTNGDVAYLQERGRSIMARSPPGGGCLVGSTPENMDLRVTMKRIADANGVDHSAVAVAWLLALTARIMPVMGTNNLARIAALSDA